MKTRIGILTVVMALVSFKSMAGTLECSVTASPNHDSNYTQLLAYVKTDSDSIKQQVLLVDASDSMVTALSFNPTGPSLQLAVSSTDSKKIYAMAFVGNVGLSNFVMLYDPNHDRMIGCSIKQ